MFCSNYFSKSGKNSIKNVTTYPASMLRVDESDIYLEKAFALGYSIEK